MKKYRIRKNSPAEYIIDFSVGGLIGLVVFAIFLAGL